MAYKKKTKKIRRILDTAVVHVNSTFNNTLVTVTDPATGDVILRSSAGKLGFKGNRKGTPYAASTVGSSLAKEMASLGIKRLDFKMRGPGSAKDNVVRSMQPAFEVREIAEVTPLPHNGTRAPKKRRV